MRASGVCDYVHPDQEQWRFAVDSFHPPDRMYPSGKYPRTPSPSPSPPSSPKHERKGPDSQTPRMKMELHSPVLSPEIRARRPKDTSWGGSASPPSLGWGGGGSPARSPPGWGSGAQSTGWGEASHSTHWGAVSQSPAWGDPKRAEGTLASADRRPSTDEKRFVSLQDRIRDTPSFLDNERKRKSYDDRPVEPDLAGARRIRDREPATLPLALRVCECTSSCAHALSPCCGFVRGMIFI